MHVIHGRRHEHCERDDLLQDLELAEFQVMRVAVAFGADLQQILEDRDRPTDEHRDEPGLVGQVVEMAVPSERHEDIGNRQQQRDDGDDGRVQDYLRSSS
jgi:hypothetical protein